MAARTAALLLSMKFMKAAGFGVGLCEPAQRTACDTALLDCKLSVAADDRDGICACATIFYAACLPIAGCSTAEEMMSCVEELMRWDCQDMSVCGNDCTMRDDDPISMERCSDDDYRVCDLAVAPRALTAVAFPPDVTYLRVEQCLLIPAVSGGDGGGSGEGDAEEIWECLRDPLPAEYYGVTATLGGAGSSSSSVSSASLAPLSHWPTSVDVDYSVAAMCERDSHCPGSYCSEQDQPRICAPKLGEHFEETGAHFLDPRWEIIHS